MSQFFKETSVYKIDHEKYSQNYDHIFGNKEKAERMTDEEMLKVLRGGVYRCGSSDAYENLVSKLEDQLKLAEREVISRGENFNKVKAQLDKANEVIGFYGNKKNWDGGDSCYANVITFNDCGEELEHEDFAGIGGKRAREYQEKYN